MEDIFYTPALEMGRRLHSGELSAVEVAESFIERIADLNPKIGAYITPTPEVAREHAKASEDRIRDGKPAGPLDGVPVSIKDLSLTAGIRTTLGSKAFENFVPPINEYYVDRILGAGMVLLGKTNAPEFGALPTSQNLVAPPTLNPWNLERTTGGSSSGAAAALAAGLCPVAEGSDGGGSMRIPSAACGVLSIKPSRGRVSHGPLRGESPAGLSTSGPMARAVADLAALLDVISGPFPGDPAPAPPPAGRFLDAVEREPGKLRIGWYTKDALGETANDVTALMRTFAVELADLGHNVEEISVSAEDISLPFLTVWAASVASIPLPGGLDDLDPVVRPLAEQGHQVSAPQYLQAERELVLWVRNNIAPLFEEFDVLLAPILSHSAPEIGYLHEDHQTALARAIEWVHWTPPFNISGQPAAAIPIGFCDDGMPMGAQLVGRRWAEETLISLSAQLEQARGGLFQKPPL